MRERRSHLPISLVVVTAGLKSFAEDFPQAEKFLLYGGRDRVAIGGIKVIPWEEFLMTLG